MLDRRLAKPATIDADQIAIDALGYIASEPDLMQRFLDLTGIEADGIRQAAGQPSFFVGVLDFLLANENDVVAFSHATGTPLETVQIAQEKLDRGSAG
jgi:hypothetical protein